MEVIISPSSLLPNCNIKCDKHMDKKNVPCDDKPSTKIVQKIAERKK
jgi:hypothetical protein